jgi:serine/threonine protein kinase
MTTPLAPRPSAPRPVDAAVTVDATWAASVEADVLPGQRLGPWILEERLGEGAMCRVHRARDDAGQRVAIKLLLPSRRRDPAHAERLRREASVSMSLGHPNIVRVLEHGVASPLGPYLVMELVDGPTLEGGLAREAPLAPARAARIIREIALGLGAAHHAGFVHRDLKPANLMLSLEGGEERVKILDFGLVGAASPRSLGARLTEDDLVIGTPSYMAPEQLGRARITQAADLYALGALLHHALSGAPPFVGSFKEIVAQHLVAEPAPLPHAEGLEHLARALLAKSPSARPASADEVVTWIDTLFPELGRGRIATGAARTATPRRITRAPLWATVLLALVLGVVAGAVVAHAVLGPAPSFTRERED